MTFVAPTYWLQKGARVRDSELMLGDGYVVAVGGMGNHAEALVRFDSNPDDPVLVQHRDLELAE